MAFASLWIAGTGEEIAVDLMRFGPDAPRGAMDFLFVELMLWGRAQGYRWLNLGMAPLAGLEPHPLAPAWHRVGNFVFRHGEHFYNFDGLRRYKAKFNPVWESKYLASPGRTRAAAGAARHLGADLRWRQGAVCQMMRQPSAPGGSIRSRSRCARRLAGIATRCCRRPPAPARARWCRWRCCRKPFVGGRKILMLEPRRLAARAVAARMASLLGERVGDTVGYRMRLDTRVSRATRIEVVTEGVLTRLLQEDPALEQVACLIFDEYHERSLAADLGLAFALDARRELGAAFRVLIMSATLDGERVASLLGDAEVVSVPGRSFPVEIRYLGRALPLLPGAPGHPAQALPPPNRSSAS